MQIKTGADIVDIGEFKKSSKSDGEFFLRKIFLPLELKNQNLEHLAGLFAAKEAVIKCLGLKAGSWLKIEIKNLTDGKPVVSLSHFGSKKIKSYDLSISHTQDQAIAVFVALFLE